MRLNISCLLELGRAAEGRATCGAQAAGPTQRAIFCAYLARCGLQDHVRGGCGGWAAFLLHRVKAQMLVVLRLLHVEATWLETQWGVEG